MTKSLQKTQKKIAKKKGNLTALHQNSRDSQRLRRAQGRDDKLEKIASARRKVDRLLLERATYFQEAIRRNNGMPLPLETIQNLIKTYVGKYDDELSQLKRERRPGRPASTREDLLRMKIVVDQKEYRDGFYLPDLTDEINVVCLDRWEGAWSYLATLKWVRITENSEITASKFPPKGDN